MRAASRGTRVPPAGPTRSMRLPRITTVLFVAMAAAPSRSGWITVAPMMAITFSAAQARAAANTRTTARPRARASVIRFLRRASTRRPMAHHFDVVPVRSDDERGIVMSVVTRLHLRRAVVPTARRECLAVERVDLRPVVREKREMQRGARCARRHQPERCLVPLPESDGLGILHEHAHAERRQRAQEELGGGLQIGYRKADMIEHQIFRFSSLKRARSRSAMRGPRSRPQRAPSAMLSLRSAGMTAMVLRPRALE